MFLQCGRPVHTLPEAAYSPDNSKTDYSRKILILVRSFKSKNIFAKECVGVLLQPLSIKKQSITSYLI